MIGNMSVPNISPSVFSLSNTLREKRPYSDQKNSKNGHFSRSESTKNFCITFSKQFFPLKFSLKIIMEFNI